MLENLFFSVYCRSLCFSKINYRKILYVIHHPSSLLDLGPTVAVRREISIVFLREHHHNLSSTFLIQPLPATAPTSWRAPHDIRLFVYTQSLLQDFLAPPVIAPAIRVTCRTHCHFSLLMSVTARVRSLGCPSSPICLCFATQGRTPTRPGAPEMSQIRSPYFKSSTCISQWNLYLTQQVNLGLVRLSLVYIVRIIV